VDTQREMEDTSLSETLQVEIRMLKALKVAERALSRSSDRDTMLRISQQKFMSYVESHVALITAESDGTTASLRRNAVVTLLYLQRTEILVAYLKDVAPDLDVYAV
jgi:sensor domain CHASE-containing protein